MRTRRVVTRTAVVSLGAAAVVGAVLVTNTSPPKPVAANTHTVPPKPMALTGVVGEGSVSKLVSSKGVLAAAKTINLGFPIGHKLSSINVKVGDKVKKGQLLAVEGHAGQEETVLQSLQTLAGQRANLALILNDVTVPGDYTIYQAQRKVVEDDRHNIELKLKADEDTLRRARELLRIDEQALEAALKKAAADLCGPNGPLEIMPTAAETTLCASDDAAIKAAQLVVFNQRTAVITDEDNLKVDRGNLETTLATALVTLKTDENVYRIAATNRPSQIAIQQAALLADEWGLVINNQGTLDNDFIIAPADGTVTAVTGVAPEFMQGDSAYNPPSPLAPGSNARIPDVGAAATSDQQHAGTVQGLSGLQALRATAPGEGPTIQLSDLSAFQVVVPFPETDAVRIQPGSTAKLTFDALPGTEEDGTVTSIASTAVDINGVTNYYATVLLSNVDPALKSGLTTTVSVVTNTVKNRALVVPSSAVTTQDGKSFVDTPGPAGRPRRVPFTPGKIGDDNTEVLSGLGKGQKVLLPPSGALPQPQPHATRPH